MHPSGALPTLQQLNAGTRRSRLLTDIRANIQQLKITLSSKQDMVNALQIAESLDQQVEWYSELTESRGISSVVRMPQSSDRNSHANRTDAKAEPVHGLSNKQTAPRLRCYRPAGGGA